MEMGRLVNRCHDAIENALAHLGMHVTRRENKGEYFFGFFIHVRPDLTNSGARLVRRMPPELEPRTPDNE